MTGRDYERELGGLQATVGAMAVALGELGRKMDVVAESVGALHAEVKVFTGYQHERNHALGNGIDAARDEVSRHAQDSKVRSDTLLATLDDHARRISGLETTRAKERAFVAGVSGAVSGAVAAVTWWFTHGTK